MFPTFFCKFGFNPLNVHRRVYTHTHTHKHVLYVANMIVSNLICWKKLPSQILQLNTTKHFYSLWNACTNWQLHQHCRQSTNINKLSSSTTSVYSFLNRSNFWAFILNKWRRKATQNWSKAILIHQTSNTCSKHRHTSIKEFIESHPYSSN